MLKIKEIEQGVVELIELFLLQSLLLNLDMLSNDSLPAIKNLFKVRIKINVFKIQAPEWCLMASFCCLYC